MNEQYQIQNMEDFSMSVLQPQDSPKKSKTHASFSGPVKKSQIYDSFSLDAYPQPPTQNNSKQASQSQSITQGNQFSPQKQQMRNLFDLQQQLQKQYLMLVKEETEKKKFMKEIDDEMKNYYTLLIEMKKKNPHNDMAEEVTEQQAKSQQKPANRIVNDDGFDNCSNFVKEVVINTSKFYQVAVTLLMNCTISVQTQDKGSIFIKDYLCLVDFFVNVLYERVCQTDPFLKQITKLICSLLSQLPQLKDQQKQNLISSFKQSKSSKKKPEIKTNYEKILLIFNVYLQKQQVQDYFEILSNSILKKIEKISFNRVQNRNRTGVSLHQSKSIIDTQGSIDLEKQFMDPSSSFGFKLQQNWLEYFKPFESFNDQKRALAMSFLSQIYSEADLCPMNLKIVLKYFYESQFGYFEEKYPLKMRNQIKQLASLKVWELIEKQYLRGFEHKNTNQSILYRQMSSFDIEILNDVVRMVRSFFGKRDQLEYYEDEELLEVYKKSKKFIIKVVQKLMSFNQDKYAAFKRSVSGEHKDLGQMKLKKNQSEVVRSSSQSANKNANQQLLANSRITLTSRCIESSIMTPNNKAKVIDMDYSHNHANLKVALPPQLIRIYGGCISFKQIHILLTSLKKIVSKIPNQRIINRVNRIFDMSPKLQFLTKHKLVKHPNQIQSLHIILLELQFDQLISDDYRNLYLKEYEDDKVKNMIRQVMCELKLKELSSRVNKRELVNKKKVNIREFQLQDFKMFKKNKSPQKPKLSTPTEPQPNILMNLLQKISNECSRSVQGTQVQFSLHKGVSIQLLKKIKYLLYLFHKSSEINESQILKEMLQQVKYRSGNMVQIYQHTKFGLLSAIGNIRHYKNLLISKKEIEQKINLRIKHIKQLQKLHLSICLTSPFSRSHPQFSLKDHSPSKQTSQQSFVSIQSPKKTNEKITSSSFTKQKPSKQDQYSPLIKQSISKEPSTIFFEPYNKYKYRISNADDIMVCETVDCIHKDNIFLGLSYHATTIQQFIQMFSNMREVNQNMFFAGFVVSEDVSKRIFAQVSSQLKHYPPVNHPMATVYIHKKYQQLHYSIDKINAVLYEFIEYVVNGKLVKDTTQLSRQQLLELRKVVKNIILRGLHERLVKKMEKRIKVKFGQSRRVSLKRKQEQKLQKKCMKNNNLDMTEQLPDLLKDFEAEEIEQEQLLMVDVNQTQNGSKSTEVDVRQQNNSIRTRELSRSSRKSSKKQSNLKQQLMDQAKKQSSQQQIDSTLYQSRNDQILLLQMQAIKNSPYFQETYLSSNGHDHPMNESRQSVESEFSTRQLEQVCARYIRNINKKETPQDKIQLLKNISDIYKLIVKDQSTEGVNHSHHKNHHTNNTNEQKHHNSHQYTLQKLIFRSLLIAQPSNFITNLAFIQTFLHKDKLLSNDGKILTQFKNITLNIFEMKNLHQYLEAKPATQVMGKDGLQNKQLEFGALNWKMRSSSTKESPIP